MKKENEPKEIQPGGRKPAGMLSGAVLIVDDCLDEARLAGRILNELNLRNPVAIVSSGAELIDYLGGEGEYQDRTRFPMPILIFLDLKMEGMDGFAILEWLRSKPKYASIPVVVLSGMEDAANIARAYQFGARTFLRKPLAAMALQHTFQALKIPLQF